MRKIAVLCFALGTGLAFADASVEPPKNLQVLPKSTSKADVKKIMKAQARALDVDCDHCHEVPDMASDKVPNKEIARQMMKMVNEINAKYIKGLKDAEKHPVTCATCHRGKDVPTE
jgi:photosynthetic reaction center cytochrome c subunit